MTNAEEALQRGDLAVALTSLQEQVRATPSSAELRVFLFQLLCITGDWGRALTQLKVAGDLDAGAIAMVQTYRELLQVEALRARVFEGETTPLIFGEPEEWIAKVVEALRVDASGHAEKARDLRSVAFDAAPEIGGSINGTGFSWIADADSRIGPFLEAVVNGRYYWIPFHRISQLRCEDPEDLRDFVWVPAQFVWQNGGEAVGFVPTRYAGTEKSSDDLLKLSRKTEWSNLVEDMYAGLGQRMLTTDVDDYPILELRSLELATADLES